MFIPASRGSMVDKESLGTQFSARILDQLYLSRGCTGPQIPAPPCSTHRASSGRLADHRPAAPAPGSVIRRSGSVSSARVNPAPR
jgi:hypothetical protein